MMAFESITVHWDYATAVLNKSYHNEYGSTFIIYDRKIKQRRRGLSNDNSTLFQRDILSIKDFKICCWSEGQIKSSRV